MRWSGRRSEWWI